MPEANYHPKSPSPQTVASTPQLPSSDPSSPKPPDAVADSKRKVDPKRESVEELKTSLSWRPSIHDRKLQLRALAVLLTIGVAYLCFHFSLNMTTQYALMAEQHRVDQLFQECLDHNGSPQHLIFSGTVQEDPSAVQNSPQHVGEAIALFGDSYTFPAWSEISKLPDPTIFVGRIGGGGTQRLVIITVDGNPAGARADTGNVAIHVSTYSADLPLNRKWEGDAQLNIYLKHGATFRAFEGSRDLDGNAVSFSIESDQKPRSVHARLMPDGTISIVDDAREITHDTVVYELDLTAPEIAVQQTRQ